MKGLRRILIGSNREKVIEKISIPAHIQCNCPIIKTNGEDFLSEALTNRSIKLIFLDYLLPKPIIPIHHFGFEMREKDVFKHLWHTGLIGIKKEDYKEFPYFSDFLHTDFKESEVYSLMQYYMPRIGPIYHVPRKSI